jgi:hypothetical protein
MSVINDMLRDLETRVAPERQAPAGLPRSLVAQKSQKSKWLLVLLALLFLVMVMSLWLLFKPNGALRAGITIDAVDSLPVMAAISESIPDTNSVQEDAEPEEPKIAARFESGEDVLGNSQQVIEAAPEVEKPLDLASAEYTVTNTTDQSAPENADKVPSADFANGKLNEDKTLLKEFATPPVAAAPSPRIDKTSVNETAMVKAVSEPKPAGMILTPKARDQANALQAADTLKQGYSQEVVDSLYRFIAENEENSLSRVVLARHMLASQRLAEVGELLAAVDGRSIVALREIKARWYATQGMLGAALQTLNSARPEVGEYPEYYALMASYYQQEGQFAEAVDTYSLLLEQNSDIADWWVGMAIGLDQMQRYNDAVLAYRQALALPNLKSSLASFSQSRLQQLTL